MFFCGVFDGHGPYGHIIASHVRDNLPSKISKAVRVAQLGGCKYAVGASDNDDENSNDGSSNSDDYKDTHSENNTGNINLSLSTWEACLVKSFKEMDQEISEEINVDSFCSGSTAVTVVKKVRRVPTSSIWQNIVSRKFLLFVSF